MGRAALVLLLLFALVAPAARGAERPFSFSAGFDYSSGTYGEGETTDILFLPFTLKHEGERLTLKGTVPYLRMTTGGGVIGGGGDVIVTAVGAEGDQGRTTESGLGDINLSASWFLCEGTRTLPMVDVTGKIKLPTADREKGLGTGEADLTFESDLTWVFGELFLFGTGGYKIYGDPPEGDLKNVLLGTFGIGRRFTERATAGLFYDLRQASSDGGSPMSEATAYLSLRYSRRFRLMAYLVKGFSDGSPDYGLGLSLATAFGLDDLRRALPSRNRAMR